MGTFGSRWSGQPDWDFQEHPRMRQVVSVSVTSTQYLGYGDMLQINFPFMLMQGTDQQGSQYIIALVGLIQMYEHPKLHKAKEKEDLHLWPPTSLFRCARVVSILARNISTKSIMSEQSETGLQLWQLCDPSGQRRIALIRYYNILCYASMNQRKRHEVVWGLKRV